MNSKSRPLEAENALSAEAGPSNGFVRENNGSADQNGSEQLNGHEGERVEEQLSTVELIIDDYETLEEGEINVNNTEITTNEQEIVINSTEFDSLIAHSLIQEETEMMDMTTEDAKTDSHSSGMSSPEHSSIDSDSVQQAADVVQEQCSPGDHVLDFLDMDIDPNDQSRSSSPAIESADQSQDVIHKPNCSLNVHDCNNIADRCPLDVSSQRNIDDDMPCSSNQPDSWSLTPGCVVGCHSCSNKGSNSLGSLPPSNPQSINISGPMGLEWTKNILSDVSETPIATDPCSLASVVLSSYFAEQAQRSDFSETNEGVWTLEQASMFGSTQNGPSNCGQTALMDVLRALKWNGNLSVIQVNVKERAPKAPLAQYLLSRSGAGTTHLDLIEAIHNFTDGKIRGHFFRIDGKENVDLMKLLNTSLRFGSLPVVTINRQRTLCRDGTVPDAWHHQMVFRVYNNQYVWVTNPLSALSVHELSRMLIGPSVLLVRSGDVLSGWNRGSNLSPILAHSAIDSRWSELNVIGQVMAVVRDKGSRLSHIAIPAAYEPGVTVFGYAESEVWNEILNTRW